MRITRAYITAIIALFLLILGCSPALAAGKKALVLAAFGSTNQEAVKSIEAFAEGIRKERPDLTVLKAFTSREVVERLKGGGEETPSVATAVSGLADEGYTEIGILSLHVMPGQGYNELAGTAQRLQAVLGQRVKISVSPPLVANEQDAFSLASYLIYSLPSEIKPGEAVFFAGRGSESAGSLIYPALNWALFLQGEKGSLYMVMNLENSESVNQAMQILKLNRRKVVWLIPLMTVNGSTTAKELFSTDDRSLASRLKDAGNTVRAHKQGLIANPAVQGMWKTKLKRLMPPPENK